MRTIASVRRPATILALACAVLLLVVASAFGHAVPVASTPQPGEILTASPGTVTVTFNEPVQLLRPEDFDVVDESGASVATTPGEVTADRRVIAIGVRPELPDGTYTARYQVIGADSHVIPSLFVFGVGVDELGEPYLGELAGGPSESGPWGVAARFAEFITLGGLIGLIAFRWLVWRTVWRRPPPMPDGDRQRLLSWWRDAYWMVFGVLALAAILAQGFVLVVQSASVLGVPVGDAMSDSTGIGQVLSETDFGSQVQIRGALLFALFAVGAIQFMREYGGGRGERPAEATGAPLVSALMLALALAVLGSISAQGHARVADWPWAQVAAHIAHSAAASVWVAGLALVVTVAVRAPRVAGASGRAVVGRTLAVFSSVATWSVIALILTGLVRTFGELEDPAELWQTAYGRSILIKLAILVPLGVIALYNRRIVAALERVARPNGPTVALLRRTVGMEVVLSLAIIAVATLLVAQVPGG